MNKLQYIDFPKNEYTECEKRLKSNKTLYTTRVSNEQGKFLLNQEYLSPFGILKVVFVKQYSKIEDHLFYNELNNKQKKEIKTNIDKRGFDIIGLILIN